MGKKVKASKLRPGMVMNTGEEVFSVAILGKRYYENGTTWFDPIEVQVEVDGGTHHIHPDETVKVRS